MSDIQNDPIFNDIMARVANFTIGFLKLKNNGSDEDAICAGSGTLVERRIIIWNINSISCP